MGETQSRYACPADENSRGLSRTAEAVKGKETPSSSTFSSVFASLVATSTTATRSSSSATVSASPIRTNLAQCDAAAAAAPPLPPPPSPAGDQLAPPPPPAAASSESAAAPPDSIEAAAKLASSFVNPGPYEQAISDGKRLVMVDTFDGFRCDINKQVSPFMLAAHSFHLGTTMFPDGRKSSYAFMAQVADEQGMIMARIDPSRGSVDGRIHKALLGGAAVGKLQIGVSQEGGPNDTLLAEVDLFGHTWSSNVKYGSMGGGLVYGANYIQAVHPNVALGGEGMYISANQNLVASYGAKFSWQSAQPQAAAPNSMDALKEAIDATSQPAQPPPGMLPPETGGNNVLCLNYNSGQMAVTANYKRCITPNRLTLGAELQFSPLSLESQLLMGAEYKWQRSKMNLCVDGSGRIQSVVEAKYGMAPGSPSILFSAEMDHGNDSMKFGYGINIDS